MPDKAESDHLDYEPIWAVLGDVVRERERQHQKWGEQNHPDGTGPYSLGGLLADDRHRYAVGLARWAKARTDAAAERGGVTWTHILTEEWAEAMAENDPERLRAELIQVAAVAVQWVELIDRRMALPPASEGGGDRG